MILPDTQLAQFPPNPSIHLTPASFLSEGAGEVAEKRRSRRRASAGMQKLGRGNDL